MRKLITAIQMAVGFYIYCTAGKSDFVGMSMLGIVIRVATAMCLIAILQKIKKSACGNRRTKSMV